MINGAVWIPLVFLFQLRASRSPRPAANAALSGMFLGIAFLGGHHQIPIFTSVAWTGVWIYLLARNRRLLVPAAAALLFAALSGAMQTLPAYEYGRLAKRWVSAPEPIAWNQPVPYSIHAYYDVKAFSLFGIVFPGVKAHFDPPPPPSEDPPPEKALVFTVSDAALLVTLPALFVTVTV